MNNGIRNGRGNAGASGGARPAHSGARYPKGYGDRAASPAPGRTQERTAARRPEQVVQNRRPSEGYQSAPQGRNGYTGTPQNQAPVRRRTSGGSGRPQSADPSRRNPQRNEYAGGGMTARQNGYTNGRTPPPGGYGRSPQYRDRQRDEAERRAEASRARLAALREQRRREEYERYRAEEERRRRAVRERELRLREERRALKAKIRARKKIERKRALKIFAGRLLVGSVIFVILALIASAVCLILFMRSPDAPSSSKLKYVYSGSSVREADAGTAYRDGVRYLCFNDLADFLSMAVTGNADEMKFIFPDWEKSDGSAGTGDEASVTFRDGSRTVSVGSRHVTASAEARRIGDEMWVPADFVESYFNGILVSYNKSKNTLSISHVENEELTTDEKKVDLPVTLKLRDQKPMEGYAPGNVLRVPDVKFLSDLSEFEPYMNPPDASEYLVLVNRENALAASYVPEGLTDLPMTRQDGRAMQKARLFAEKSLEALFTEMYAMGYTDVAVTSGYRSYADQTALFENYVAGEINANPALSREEAEAIALTYSSLPGTSEHQTGLSVDMHNGDYANETFAETEAYRWLSENAWKFGFILRFPEGKTDLTGVKFEPWHWRYVGRSAAYAIKEQNICLEEYAFAVKP